MSEQRNDSQGTIGEEDGTAARITSQSHQSHPPLEPPIDSSLSDEALLAAARELISDDVDWTNEAAIVVAETDEEEAGEGGSDNESAEESADHTAILPMQERSADAEPPPLLPLSAEHPSEPASEPVVNEHPQAESSLTLLAPVVANLSSTSQPDPAVMPIPLLPPVNTGDKADVPENSHEHMEDVDAHAPIDKETMPIASPSNAPMQTDSDNPQSKQSTSLAIPTTAHPPTPEEIPPVPPAESIQVASDPNPSPISAPAQAPYTIPTPSPARPSPGLLHAVNASKPRRTFKQLRFMPPVIASIASDASFQNLTHSTEFLNLIRSIQLPIFAPNAKVGPISLLLPSSDSKGLRTKYEKVKQQEKKHKENEKKHAAATSSNSASSSITPTTTSNASAGSRLLLARAYSALGEEFYQSARAIEDDPEEEQNRLRYLNSALSCFKYDLHYTLLSHNSSSSSSSSSSSQSNKRDLLVPLRRLGEVYQQQENYLLSLRCLFEYAAIAHSFGTVVEQQESQVCLGLSSTDWHEHWEHGNDTSTTAARTHGSAEVHELISKDAEKWHESLLRETEFFCTRAVILAQDLGLGKIKAEEIRNKIESTKQSQTFNCAPGKLEKMHNAQNNLSNALSARISFEREKLVYQQRMERRRKEQASLLQGDINLEEDHSSSSERLAQDWSSSIQDSTPAGSSIVSLGGGEEGAASSSSAASSSTSSTSVQKALQQVTGTIFRREDIAPSLLPLFERGWLAASQAHRDAIGTGKSKLQSRALHSWGLLCDSVGWAPEAATRTIDSIALIEMADRRRAANLEVYLEGVESAIVYCNKSMMYPNAAVLVKEATDVFRGCTGAVARRVETYALPRMKRLKEDLESITKIHDKLTSIDRELDQLKSNRTPEVERHSWERTVYLNKKKAVKYSVSAATMELNTRYYLGEGMKALKQAVVGVRKLRQLGAPAIIPSTAPSASADSNEDVPPSATVTPSPTAVTAQEREQYDRKLLEEESHLYAEMSHFAYRLVEHELRPENMAPINISAEREYLQAFYSQRENLCLQAHNRAAAVATLSELADRLDALGAHSHQTIEIRQRALVIARKAEKEAAVDVEADEAHVPAVTPVEPVRPGLKVSPSKPLPAGPALDLQTLYLQKELLDKLVEQADVLDEVAKHFNSDTQSSVASNQQQQNEEQLDMEDVKPKEEDSNDSPNGALPDAVAVVTPRKANVPVPSVDDGPVMMDIDPDDNHPPVASAAPSPAAASPIVQSGNKSAAASPNTPHNLNGTVERIVVNDDANNEASPNRLKRRFLDERRRLFSSLKTLENRLGRASLQQKLAREAVVPPAEAPTTEHLGVDDSDEENFQRDLERDRELEEERAMEQAAEDEQDEEEERRKRQMLAREKAAQRAQLEKQKEKEKNSGNSRSKKSGDDATSEEDRAQPKIIRHKKRREPGVVRPASPPLFENQLGHLAPIGDNETSSSGSDSDSSDSSSSSTSSSSSASYQDSGSSDSSGGSASRSRQRRAPSVPAAVSAAIASARKARLAAKEKEKETRHAKNRPFVSKPELLEFGSRRQQEGYIPRSDAPINKADELDRRREANHARLAAALGHSTSSSSSSSSSSESEMDDDDGGATSSQELEGMPSASQMDAEEQKAYDALPALIDVDDNNTIAEIDAARRKRTKTELAKKTTPDDSKSKEGSAKKKSSHKVAGVSASRSKASQLRELMRLQEEEYEEMQRDWETLFPVAAAGPGGSRAGKNNKSNTKTKSDRAMHASRLQQDIASSLAVEKRLRRMRDSNPEELLRLKLTRKLQRQRARREERAIERQQQRGWQVDDYWRGDVNSVPRPPVRPTAESISASLPTALRADRAVANATHAPQVRGSTPPRRTLVEIEDDNDDEGEISQNASVTRPASRPPASVERASATQSTLPFRPNGAVPSHQLRASVSHADEDQDMRFRSLNVQLLHLQLPTSHFEVPSYVPREIRFWLLGNALPTPMEQTEAAALVKKLNEEAGPQITNRIDSAEFITTNTTLGEVIIKAQDGLLQQFGTKIELLHVIPPSLSEAMRVTDLFEETTSLSRDVFRSLRLQQEVLTRNELVVFRQAPLITAAPISTSTTLKGEVKVSIIQTKLFCGEAKVTQAASVKESYMHLCKIMRLEPHTFVMELLRSPSNADATNHDATISMSNPTSLKITRPVAYLTSNALQPLLLALHNDRGSLQSLHLSTSSFDGTCAKLFTSLLMKPSAPFMQLQGVQDLSLAHAVNVSTTEWNALIPSLKLLPSLTSLDLSYSSLDGHCVPALGALLSTPAMKHLRCLNLSGCNELMVAPSNFGVDDETFMDFLTASESVTEYYLDFLPFTHAGLAMLLQCLEEKKDLQVLSLKHLPCMASSKSAHSVHLPSSGPISVPNPSSEIESSQRSAVQHSASSTEFDSQELSQEQHSAEPTGVEPATGDEDVSFDASMNSVDLFSSLRFSPLHHSSNADLPPLSAEFLRGYDQVLQALLEFATAHAQPREEDDCRSKVHLKLHGWLNVATNTTSSAYSLFLCLYQTLQSQSCRISRVELQNCEFEPIQLLHFQFFMAKNHAIRIDGLLRR